MNTLNKWLNNVQYFVFPATCVFCEQKGMTHIDLCSTCYNEFKPLASCCCVCAEPFEEGLTGVCGHCLTDKPYFNKVFTPYLYEGLAKKAVINLKNNHQFAFAKIIAYCLNQYWNKTFPLKEYDAVIPIPTHINKKRQRGFNQGELITLFFTRSLGLPYKKNIVERIKWQENQVSLNRKKRIANIKNAFKFIGKNQAPKRILIVDDVVTTAATVNEVAKTLKAAGANEVDVLAFARTPK